MYSNKTLSSKMPFTWQKYHVIYMSTTEISLVNQEKQFSLINDRYNTRRSNFCKIVEVMVEKHTFHEFPKQRVTAVSGNIAVTIIVQSMVVSYHIQAG